jgi:hypothetical protein
MSTCRPHWSRQAYRPGQAHRPWSKCSSSATTSLRSTIKQTLGRAAHGFLFPGWPGRSMALSGRIPSAGHSEDSLQEGRRNCGSGTSRFLREHKRRSRYHWRYRRLQRGFRRDRTRDCEFKPDSHEVHRQNQNRMRQTTVGHSALS